MNNEYTRAFVTTITILGCVYLIVNGHDGEIKAVFGAVVGFFFGQYIPSPKENGKDQL